jgi:hypothetical protein
VTLFWTVVAAVAAAVSALMAAVYTWLTFRLVRGQAEPKVVVYVCADPDRQTILMIRIANIGRDVATNIAFRSSRPLPQRAYGLTLDDPSPAQPMRDGPLIDGIPVLGPGDSRDITWGQFGGLMKAVGSEPIELTFVYKHGRRTLRGRSRLEVASYVGTDDSENPASKAADNLEKIAKGVKKIAEEVGRPHRERQARRYRRERLRDTLSPSDQPNATNAKEATVEQEET